MSVTERLYGRLPEFYRDADAEQVPALPLRRYISLTSDQADEVETLWERLHFDQGVAPATSDLTDPVTADVGWLPWLAQLVGVRLDARLTEVEARDAVRFASSGWRAGTKSAVRDAARTALTGSKYASVYDHSINAPGDGGQWDVLLVTADSETPSVAAVLAAVIAKGAKPAGVVLRVRSFGASWTTVEASYPTWSAVEAAGSWQALQETGL